MIIEKLSCLPLIQRLLVRNRSINWADVYADEECCMLQSGISCYWIHQEQYNARDIDENTPLLCLLGHREEDQWIVPHETIPRE